MPAPAGWLSSREVRFAFVGFPATRLPMQGVIDYLKKNEARFVQELCEYVRFPSVSAQPQHRQDLRACAEWVVKHCQGNRPGSAAMRYQGQSDCGRQNAARQDARRAPSALRGLRALRCAAAGAAGSLEIAAVRAAHRQRRALRARRERQQRPEPGTPQGGGGLSQDGNQAAVRYHLRHRRRGGSGQQQPRILSASAPGGAGLRCDRHFGHGHADAQTSRIDLRVAGNRRLPGHASRSVA